MKIYTKTGDKGKTRLVDGSCVDKSNPRVDCYGTVDELSSFLGLLLSEMKTEIAAKSELEVIQLDIKKIQNLLFNVGSVLACEDSKIQQNLPRVTKENVIMLEKSMDHMSEDLPPLKEFILPGGHKLASLCHVARTVCRRAERHTTLIYNDSIENEFIFLNRLSDYLFMLARYLNYLYKQVDEIWKK